MKRTRNISNILMVLFILVPFVIVQRNLFPNVETETITKTDTLYQDTTIYVDLPKPYPVYIDTGSTRIIKLPTDSLSIVKAYMKLHKDYFAVKYYNDTLKNDTTALIVLKETVTQNSVEDRSLIYKNRVPTIINTTTTNIYSKKQEFLFGADIGVNEFSPGIIYKTKKDLQFKLSYDVLGNDKGLRIGVYSSFNIFKND